MSGLVGTLALNGPLALGAWWVSGGMFGNRRDRILAAAVVAWCWITLGMQGLGMVGGIGVWPLAGVSAGLLIVGGAVRFGLPRKRGDGASTGSWGLVGAGSIALVILPCIVLGMRSLLGPVKVVSDGPIYHLYFAARWWQAGRLELVPVPFGENAATYFPAGGDLVFCWLLTGWGGDQLAKVGAGPFSGVKWFSSLFLRSTWRKRTGCLGVGDGAVLDEHSSARVRIRGERGHDVRGGISGV